MNRKILISADDFGLSVEVNEAVEIAHRQGILSTANLMIGGNAAEDAIKRAKRMPNLRVGLHIVVIEGKSILPKREIPLLVDNDQLFPSQQFKMSINYYFNKDIQKQLSKEIKAQFEAFRKTGLTLDHVDVHKHMHLHPTIAQLILKANNDFNIQRIRLPHEPVSVLQAIDQTSSLKNINNLFVFYWSKLLKQQIIKANMRSMDWCFGLSWCGHMTFDRVQKLIPKLPYGNSEIFFHPAINKTGLYNQLMPHYEPVKELETLCHADFPKLLQEYNIQPITWDHL